MSFPFYSFFSAWFSTARRKNTCKSCGEKHIAKGDKVLEFVVFGGSTRSRQVALSCANQILDQYITGFQELKDKVAEQIATQKKATQSILAMPTS
jgi:hypothetical protein